MTRYSLFVLAAVAATGALAQSRQADIVVYGCTSGGVASAVQARKMGRSVVMVCPEKHLGGLTAGGLGFTDTGNKAVIGGLSREFYHRVWQHYQRPEAWRWQKREEFGNKGQGTEAMDQGMRTMWIFEPHVAEGVFEEWVKEHQIPVVRNAWLDRQKGVRMEQGRIASIRTLDGKTYRGRMFIDATYEGDLMAAAGVDYHVGRESMKTYGEQWAGVQTGVLHHRHHFGVFKSGISPYVVPGDPSSGVLPRISTEPPGEYGAGDKKVQAYCFRMCLTRVEANRVPFPKPANYDPKQYELLLRIFEAGWRETFDKFDAIPNAKTDTNNHGPFSTDNIGRNYDYPEASYERRREIIREHVEYQQGWLYFIANDPRVPEVVRTAMAKWGLAKDEFTDNGNWPHQIYVREARRMVGRYVMTENELLKKRPTPEPVGMGSYGIDSHNIQRYITPEGYVQNEGDIGVSTRGPYQISYGALVPKKGQAANLLVPVAVSSSHIAYGSIRMEPVFMILGQSAATAASMAIDGKMAVQEVPYEKLRARLLADGQVLEYQTPPPPAAAAAKRPARPQPPARDPRTPGYVEAKELPEGTTPSPKENGNFIIGPTYPPAPEMTVQPNVPQGQVFEFTMESKDSKFYPGIAREPGTFARPDPDKPGQVIVNSYPAPYTRKVAVYVPKQYVPGTEAPFIVGADGPDRMLFTALDNLIAAKRVPVMIAISIGNGSGDAQGSQRGLEYDTMSGKYAEFVEQEVLPLAAERAGVKLTKDPDGRATMGCSSGASAAMAMAWYRTDLYHRVLSYSGTYVYQQWPYNPETPHGAWDFHETLIPNSPRKPLRIWMHVSDRDNLITRDEYHDWVLANERMAKVLAAKGYPYQFVFSKNSGHCDRAVKANTLPLALEYVWQGYGANSGRTRE